MAPPAAGSVSDASQKRSPPQRFCEASLTLRGRGGLRQFRLAMRPDVDHVEQLVQQHEEAAADQTGRERIGTKVVVVERRRFPGDPRPDAEPEQIQKEEPACNSPTP